VSTHWKFHNDANGLALLVPKSLTAFCATPDGNCTISDGANELDLRETFAQVEAIVFAPDFEALCGKLVKAAREVIGAIDYAESQKGKTTTDEISNLRAGLKRTLLDALADVGEQP
jgi:hypothetical protein